MSVIKASLWRRAVLSLVAGFALTFPLSAHADFLKGLSIRAGFMRPERGSVRNITDFAAWGGGIEYQLPFVPQLLEGGSWSTSISADFHYASHGGIILRYIPVSINQVFTFERHHGVAPYAGFCVTAATMSVTPSAIQPTVTRFGGGLIMGLNLTDKVYLEGRYEWIGKSGLVETPENLRVYVGYRF